MRGWPISPRVNSPENDDPQIIVPIEIESMTLEIHSRSRRDYQFNLKEPSPRRFRGFIRLQA
jgi:hypothetical protein